MICIIPARAGSQRIPGKNWKEFKGKPIIAYSIELAQKTGWDVYVSTDSKECMSIAEEYGAGVITRPDYLAIDEVGTQQVAHHALDTLSVRDDEWVCILYPTSPLLTDQDLVIGYLLLKKFDYLPCVFSVDENGDPSGGFFIAEAIFFYNEEDPYQNGHPLVTGDIDINDEVDWVQAEKLWEERYGAA